MKLKRFEVKHGGQFNGEAPIVIDFSKSKFVGVTGDQEQGKTTILELFLMACGQLGGEKIVEALKNRDTDKIDAELSFVGNDRNNYEVKLTKSSLTVLCDGEKKPAPAELLKKMLGVVGTNPMAIKNEPVEEIVKWLSKYSTKSAAEFEKDMLKIKEGLKKSRKARAEANKAAKGLREYLVGESVIDSKGELIESKWKENEKTFAKKVDIKEISDRLEEAGKKSDKYIQNEAKVKAQKDRKKQVEEQLRLLQEELALLDKNIGIGDKWLSDNKNVKKEYDDIKSEYDNSSKKAIEYNKWQEIKKKKSEMDQFDDLAVKADNTEKDLLKQQQELQWEVIPDIKGAELILEDTHEDEGEQRKAGFYYNGMSSRQMSESEWVGVVVQIMKKDKVPVLILDGISNFGSKLMGLLEGLVKSGCVVMYSEMKRGATEVSIEYN